MIIFASNNEHKVDELKSILFDYDIKTLKDVGFNQEIIENGDSFEQNSLIKAQTIAHAFPNAIVISDDSGICVDYLNGYPGIYSARFSGEHGNSDANNQRLLTLLDGVKERNAQFVCVVCCIIPGYEPRFFRGKLEGTIAYEINGEHGFGYDPLFVLKDGRHLASLTNSEKNNISHRKLALTQLAEYIGAQCIH